VFISYASQDAEAATRICAALRAAGIEVWLDQSELRGGDAWDRQIRERIHDCRLFMALISANTQARDEGYFRREWKLAADRTHDMLEKKAFLLPVAIDATPERGAAVPDKFHEVQWTRLPGGETTPEFVERVQRLLLPETSTTSQPRASAAPGTIPTPRISASPPIRWSKPALRALAAVLVLAALAYFVADKFWISKRVTAPPTIAATSPMTAAAPASAAAFNPPPHSIAVLPFVNMSADKEQEYFSDGLTEEILNSLTRINELQVSARTSSFSFKGKDADISTIAHKLNVASVLEGSVRRAGDTVRVTAQLNNAVTGFHLWSQTYDRNLSNVLQLQTEIANAVANALKVTLLGNVSEKIEAGGTRNPEAFDAYLRGRKAFFEGQSDNVIQAAMAAYSEAIRLDPDYALAFANRSLALFAYAAEIASGPSVRESIGKAQQDALKAVALAPDLAEGHLALAVYFEFGSLDFIRATEEYERALALAPGNARILRDYGSFAVKMGRNEAGIAAIRRAVLLDPLDRQTHLFLGSALLSARQYTEAVSAFQDALALGPDYPATYLSLGLAYYVLGNFQKARELCERVREHRYGQLCLVLTYDKLGRHADAEAMLAKYRATLGDAGAYGYAQIYAQRGTVSKGLEWLETALRLHESGLDRLKVDPFLDPLRNEPRFQAIERALKFPE
jgi:TolB-like protein/Tfp pilus assembly protein PilF